MVRSEAVTLAALAPGRLSFSLIQLDAACRSPGRRVNACWASVQKVSDVAVVAVDNSVTSAEFRCHPKTRRGVF